MALKLPFSIGIKKQKKLKKKGFDVTVTEEFRRGRKVKGRTIIKRKKKRK